MTGVQTCALPISNDEELKNSSVNKEVSQFNLEDPLKNVEVKNIVNLVHKLQQNHIKVVLFLTPLNRHYLDIIPEKQTLIFNSIILYIKNETNVPIYNLQDKYANFPIWQDSSHVAINEKSLIYSEDVGKIILDELDS